MAKPLSTDYDALKKEFLAIRKLTNTIKQHAKKANASLIDKLLTVNGDVDLDLLKNEDVREKALDYLEGQFKDFLKTNQKINLDGVNKLIQSQIMSSVYGFDREKIREHLEIHQEEFTEKFEELLEKNTDDNYEHYHDMAMQKYDLSKNNFEKIIKTGHKNYHYLTDLKDKVTDTKDIKDIIRVLYHSGIKHPQKAAYFNNIFNKYVKPESDKKDSKDIAYKKAA